MREIARARPLLGTIVGIRVGGLPEGRAIAVIESAFGEIAAIHRCMSFHEPGSDLSRLHRAGCEPVSVDARTYEVLARSLAIAEQSGGLFDPSVAPRLVEWNLLPAPEDTPAPDADATWRDIDLLDDGHVRLRRPMWIDLGGIAKGFAVDRALAILRASGCASASVNAGGDLARFGPSPEPVVLDPGCDDAAAAIELGDGAVATSGASRTFSRICGRLRGVHVHGRQRHAVGARRGVSVVAASCCIADALTKVVLADMRVGARMLRRHRAHAYSFDVTHGWRRLGTP